MLGGQLSASVGYGAMFAVVAGTMAAVMVLFNIYQRRQPKAAPQVAEEV